MDLLLCIVEAQAAAKALAKAGGKSVHAVEDCASVIDVCSKVLPAAFSVLEGAVGIAMDGRDQAVACVQGLTNAMGQLQAALDALNAHDGEGVLGIALEHPAAWLHTYRGFRMLTAHLAGLSCLVRTAAQRQQAEGADEALQIAVKTFMAICARARDAANLLGSDLPDFARAAAAAGWTLERMRTALQAPSPGLNCGRRGSIYECHCRASSASGALPRYATKVAATTTTHISKQACQAAARHTQDYPQQQPRDFNGCGVHWGLLRGIGRNTRGAAVCAASASGGIGKAASQQRTATAVGSPMASSGSSSRSGSESGHTGAVALDDTACTLVTRIQEALLYDSEVDQLDQDTAYLQHRVAHVREVCGWGGPGAEAAPATAVTTQMGAGAGTGCVGADEAAMAAAATILQGEVLLGAVEARLKALQGHNGRRGCTGTSGHGRSSAGFSACEECCPGCGGKLSPQQQLPHRDTQRQGQKLEGGDLRGEDGGVRSRRAGMRWLPVCFLGA